MPVDRLFHPRLGDSDKVGKLSELEFRVWFTYILAADDFGVLPMLASKIQAADRALSLRPAKVVAQALERLSKLGLVQTFVHQDTVFMWSANWQHHQKIRYPRREQTHYPAPAEATLEALDGDETSPTRELFATFHMKVTTAFRDKYGDRDAIKRIEERDRKRRVKKPRRSSDVPEMEPQPIGDIPTHTHGRADARPPETANGSRLKAEVLEEKKVVPLDRAFLDFQAAYPDDGRKGGFMCQQSFVAQCEKAGGPSALFTALENHKASERWQDKTKIPGMDKWLTEERWRQSLSPPTRTAAPGSRTAGNLAAAQRFVNRGQS